MRVVARIDAQGTFVEDVLLEDGAALPEGTVDTRPPEGFHRPRWDGSKWVEGKPSAEILESLKVAKRSEMEQAFATETAQSFGGGSGWPGVMVGVLATNPQDTRISALRTRTQKLSQKLSDVSNATTTAGALAVAW